MGRQDAVSVDPAGYLGYRIVRAAAALERRFREDLAPVGLRPREFSVLAVLSATPDVTTADLARAVLVTPQSMAALIEGLQGRGFVEREGPRRKGVAAPLTLTDAGRDVVAAAAVRVAEGEREVFGDFTPRQRDQLAGLLRRVQAKLPE